MIYKPNILRMRAIQALTDTHNMQTGCFYLSPIDRANKYIKQGQARRVQAADISDQDWQIWRNYKRLRHIDSH